MKICRSEIFITEPILFVYTLFFISTIKFEINFSGACKFSDFRLHMVLKWCLLNQGVSFLQPFSPVHASRSYFLRKNTVSQSYEVLSISLQMEYLQQKRLNHWATCYFTYFHTNLLGLRQFEPRGGTYVVLNFWLSDAYRGGAYKDLSIPSTNIKCTVCYLSEIYIARPILLTGVSFHGLCLQRLTGHQQSELFLKLDCYQYKFPIYEVKLGLHYKHSVLPEYNPKLLAPLPHCKFVLVPYFWKTAFWWRYHSTLREWLESIFPFVRCLVWRIIC